MIGFHKLLTIALLVGNSGFAASDVQSVPLISTVAIDGKHAPGPGGQWLDLAATAIPMHYLSFREEILAQLNQRELIKYFPNQSERNQIAAQIEQQVKSSLGRFTNSTRMINGVRIATNETTKRIMERIFEVEKINEAGRSEAWSNRILSAVNTCFTRANNSTQAKGCATLAGADLKSNIGMAIAHQSALKHMSADIATQNAATYRQCMKGAGATAEDCTMTAIRAGAETHIRKEYMNRQNAELPGHPTDLSAAHLPALRTCVAAAITQPDFARCGDILTLNAGPEIARQRAMAQQEIRENIPAASLSAIGDTAAQAFTTCANENLAGNVRDSVGALSTDNCKQRVRQAIGHQMRDVILDPQFEANSQGSKPEDTGLTQVQLDTRRTELMGENRTCINEIPNDATADRELLQCFLRSGRNIADFLGDNRFRAQLAKHLKGMPASDRAALHGRLMTDYRTCLQGASGRPGLEGCAGNAARELAHKIGTIRLRSDLGLAIGTDGLVHDSARIAQMEATYRQCLDSKTNFTTLEKDLEKCGTDLKTAGTRLVQERARAALLQSGDSRQVTALKNDIVGNIDRMSSLMPQGPIGVNETPGGALSSAMRDLNSMIRYNPASADRSLRQVIAEANRTGATAETVAAKMMQSGSVDQLIKATAFEKVVAKMRSLRGEQKPSASVLAQLTNKQNFEKIFSPQVMNQLRQKVARDMATMTAANVSPEAVTAAKARIEREVKEILMQSDRFGRLYARDRIQSGIASTYRARLAQARNQYGFLADMFAPNMPQLARTRQARRAEDRFIELLLRPSLMDNRELTAQQIAAAKADVTRHVKAALEGRETAESGRWIATQREMGVQ